MQERTSLYFHRQRAKRLVDEAAGDARTRYITDVPGQQEVYIRKREQALAYVAAYELDPGAVPLPYIRDEAEATGETYGYVANLIIMLSNAWSLEIGPRIERVRLLGKRAIDEETTVEGVEATCEQFIDALTKI